MNMALIGIALIFGFLLSMGYTTPGKAVYRFKELAKYPWGDETASPDNPFTALAFRKAMAMAFDYDAYLEDIIMGYGIRLEGMIPAGMFGHHDTLIEEGYIPTYNPDAAKVLFQQVGWTGKISLGYNVGSTGREQFATLFKTAIEAMKVGIEIEPLAMTWPDYFDAVNFGQLPMFWLGWIPDYPDPDNYMASFFHSDSYFASQLGYKNPALDADIIAASRETDPDVREYMYKVLEEQAAQDYVFLYLSQAMDFQVKQAWFDQEDWIASGSDNPVRSWPVFEFINKTSGSTASPQDTLIWKTFGSPDSLDPPSNYESTGSGMNELTRETMYSYKSADVELVPSLALSHTVSADSKNITYHLRPGITFHDGTPFNAYVMKYSIDRAVIMSDPFGAIWMIAPNFLGGMEYFGLTDGNVTDAETYLAAGGVQVIDDYTLQVNQAVAYIPFVSAMQYQICAAVSPKDVIENCPTEYITDTTDDTWGMVPLTRFFPGMTDADIRTKLGLDVAQDVAVSGVVPFSGADEPNAHTYMATSAIGTGPYIMTLYDANNSHYQFEKNTNWWNAANFHPNSPDIIHVYGEITNTQECINDMLAGDIDLGAWPTTHADQAFEADGVTPKVGLSITYPPSFTIAFIGFNVRDTLPYQFIEFNGTHVDTTTPIENGDQIIETTTITETTTEYSNIAGATKSTTEHHTITFTNEAPVLGFEIVCTLSWFFLVNIIVLLHRREKVER